MKLKPRFEEGKARSATLFHSGRTAMRRLDGNFLTDVSNSGSDIYQKDHSLRVNDLSGYKDIAGVLDLLIETFVTALYADRQAKLSCPIS